MKTCQIRVNYLSRIPLCGGFRVSWTADFDKFHRIAIDELNAFNHEEYKANGFKVKHLGDCDCQLHDRPEGMSTVPLCCKRG